MLSDVGLAWCVRGTGRTQSVLVGRRVAHIAFTRVYSSDLPRSVVVEVEVGAEVVMDGTGYLVRLEIRRGPASSHEHSLPPLTPPFCVV